MNKKPIAREAISFDERGRRVRDAWRNKFDNTSGPVPMSDMWVRDVFDNVVIVEKAEGLYSYPYTFNAKGDIEFGEPVKVEITYNAVEARIWLEAKVQPKTETEGREWDVTIIGAQDDTDLVTAGGREWVRSKNGRLYAVEALRGSVEMWNGVKVYDNHLTQEEFEKKQGMRSVAAEWIGTIVQPYWDEAAKQLRGVLKVVEAALAAKLKSAYEAGVLNTIGLSIDTFPITGREQVIEGQAWPTIEGFKKILSVDLVAEPAAGGGFNRLIAANILQENTTMEIEEIKSIVVDTVKAVLAEMAPAAQPEAVATEPEAEAGQMPPEMLKKMKGKKGKGKMPETEAEADDEPNQDAADAAEQATQEARLARCELTLERKLNAAKLPGAFRKIVEGQFAGKVFEEKDLDAAINRVKEAQASEDVTGRVAESGGQRTQVVAGLADVDKYALEFMRLMMGNTAFNALRNQEGRSTYVAERLQEANFWQAWEKDGYKPIDGVSRVSTLLEHWFGGNPIFDQRAMETASTSSLATVVKNTVNIMVAADYSIQQRWYEPLVRIEEVDTIDDATLARLFGVNTLSVVNEGAAYTELALADEEETASFVKRGNYIEITMETLMRDKINFVRTIPNRLADTWYNTLSAQVAGVFTVNSNTGPVLSTTGALFNATATSSAGGHANLLTTALSFAAFSAARVALKAQTNQPLGAGRKLLIEPRYLLVPNDLETTALQIRNSEKQPGSANESTNPFYQKFDVVVVPDWTDANDWALMGDPVRYPAIYMIFPRGARTPQLFTADSEVAGSMFTNDSLRYKVRMLHYRFSSTYDCSPVADFRPLHKSNVA